METELSREEERFVRELLTWDRTGRPLQWGACYVFLVLGGIVFVAAAALTLQHMNDRVVQWVMVPGTLMALLFFGLYILGEHRIKERRRIASVVRKLYGES